MRLDQGFAATATTIASNRHAQAPHNMPLRNTTAAIRAPRFTSSSSSIRPLLILCALLSTAGSDRDLLTPAARYMEDALVLCQERALGQDRSICGPMMDAAGKVGTMERFGQPVEDIFILDSKSQEELRAIMRKCAEATMDGKRYDGLSAYFCAIQEVAIRNTSARRAKRLAEE